MTARSIAAALALAAVVAAGCGGATEADTDLGAPLSETAEADTGPGVRLVSPAEALALQSGGGEELIVLDVRTAEEFEAGHLEGATTIDFYAPDFADQLAGLDKDASYVMYCQSGNRSGQARALMEDLGFSDVADVDGGILAWADAGLPITAP